MGTNVVDSIVDKFTNAVLKQPVKGEDVVDRLHHFVTVGLMIVFAIGIGLQEYVGKPISCWAPKGFPEDSYREHINSYCWTHKLRYPQYEREGGINDTQAFGGVLDPSRPAPLVDFGTAFFRWATLIFILQAFLFKLPNFIWCHLSSASNADIQKIQTLVQESQNAADDNSRKLKKDEVVAYFENWITGHRNYRFKFAGKHSAKLLSILFCLEKQSGSYLSSLYICYKCLNIVNVVGNFGIMTVLLDVNFWKYGLVVLNSVFTYGDWQDSNNFPRLLLCDFVVEGSTGSNPSGGSSTPAEYKIQCTMALNLLLEKVFVVEYFWLLFLFIVTFVNMVIWAVKTKPPCSTILFSKTFMKTVQSYPSLEIGIAMMAFKPTNENACKNVQKDFIENYLKSDGVLVLRLLEQNSDKMLLSEVVCALWDRYRAVQKYKDNSNMTICDETKLDSVGVVAVPEHQEKLEVNE
ncbi:innexin unc-9-like isoform X2 [Physella acuta]|uniref:innexin unc-9-like isoform X2 n=1 Tax=Physella acuta TaxID=109671 RepID=UPI0027DE1A62|nr:innexin unc-9-like isoform X2 [Physella acuta]